MKPLVIRLHQLIDFKAATKFLLVGASSAIVYFLSFTLLWEFFHLNSKVAISTGYVLSVVVHFCGNRYFTFQAGQRHLKKQLPRYLVMIFINYLITLAVVHFVVNICLLSPYLGIAASIAATVMVGYFLSKFWIFCHPEE
jgi:putative flippase GtrA